MPGSRTSFGTAAALAVAVLLGITSSPMVAGESLPQSHTVQIRNLRFSPSELVVAPGDTVVWVNKDLIPHTITADDRSWDSERLNQNDRWEIVVHEGMRETYFCRYHPSMTGRLLIRLRSTE